MANLDPRVTIGRNFKGAFSTLLHREVSEKKIFSHFFYYKSMEANDPQGRGQLGPQGHDWQDL